MWYTIILQTFEKLRRRGEKGHAFGLPDKRAPLSGECVKGDEYIVKWKSENEVCAQPDWFYACWEFKNGNL